MGVSVFTQVTFDQLLAKTGILILTETWLLLLLSNGKIKVATLYDSKVEIDDKSMDKSTLKILFWTEADNTLSYMSTLLPGEGSWTEGFDIQASAMEYIFLAELTYKCQNKIDCKKVEKEIRSRIRNILGEDKEKISDERKRMIKSRLNT